MVLDVAVHLFGRERRGACDSKVSSSAGYIGQVLLAAFAANLEVRLEGIHQLSNGAPFVMLRNKLARGVELVRMNFFQAFV